MRMRQFLLWATALAGWLVPALATGLRAGQTRQPSGAALVRTEAEYILACQYVDPASDANGAINNIHGKPTWVVPGENAMAILGLAMASEILRDDKYIRRAQWAADYLVSLQDPCDGAWCDQYDYDMPCDPNKSPRHTAEVMIALDRLGFDPDRYASMKKGAGYLWECQDHGGDGLLSGGKDRHGTHRDWRWTHDNAYAYWALKATELWATRQGDVDCAATCASRAQRVLDGIRGPLYDKDTGVWHMAIDSDGRPLWLPHLQNLPSWIQYAPQMLDLPVQDVNSARVGQWIHDCFQQPDGSCIGYTYEPKDKSYRIRKYPGHTFQAVLCWCDAGDPNAAKAVSDALAWVRKSGLWQLEPDVNGHKGGWIDWVEVMPTPDATPPEYERFIDTSFYAIAAFNGGYDFTIRDEPAADP
jgi:hypothetical protein